MIDPNNTNNTPTRQKLIDRYSHAERGIFNVSSLVAKDNRALKSFSNKDFRESLEVFHRSYQSNVRLVPSEEWRFQGLCLSMSKLALVLFPVKYAIDRILRTAKKTNMKSLR
jgi:hypothetical protein